MLTLPAERDGAARARDGPWDMNSNSSGSGMGAGIGNEGAAEDEAPCDQSRYPAIARSCCGGDGVRGVGGCGEDGDGAGAASMADPGVVSARMADPGWEWGEGDDGMADLELEWGEGEDRAASSSRRRRPWTPGVAAVLDSGGRRRQWTPGAGGGGARLLEAAAGDCMGSAGGCVAAAAVDAARLGRRWMRRG